MTMKFGAVILLGLGMHSLRDCQSFNSKMEGCGFIIMKAGVMFGFEIGDGFYKGGPMDDGDIKKSNTFVKATVFVIYYSFTITFFLW